MTVVPRGSENLYCDFVDKTHENDGAVLSGLVRRGPHRF